MFLIIGLICVPTMLFPKPYIIFNDMKHHAHQASQDDVHNKQSIPLEEKASSGTEGDIEKQKLLAEPDRENLL